MKLVDKLSILRKQLSDTKVIEGSAFLYSITFWLTKLFSLLQRRNSILDKLIHKLTNLLPTPTFIISNKSGTFAVQAYDDSTTICSDYFEKELRRWLEVPKVKNIFIDIGANRGLYTVIAPILFGYKEIHSFEPNPEVVETLSQNVKLNNLSNLVTIHNYAVGANEEITNFTFDPLHKGGGKIIAAAGENTQPISVKTLDTVLSDIVAENISFIKIDTEGFEFNVLKGMKRILAQMPIGSCLMIESNDLETITSILSINNFKPLESINFDHLFIKEI